MHMQYSVPNMHACLTAYGCAFEIKLHINYSAITMLIQHRVLGAYTQQLQQRYVGYHQHTCYGLPKPH